MLKMITELCFKIQQFNLDQKITNTILHRITVTETLNSDKSDSNQCYSESESAAMIQLRIESDQ